MQTIRNQSLSSKLQPPYHQYLMKKFKWQPRVIEMIEWRIIELTSRRSTLPDQTCIQKLTHEWLLTRISPGNTPTNKQDKLCPSCCRSNETANHLLACNHPNRHQIFNKSNQQLVQICTKKQIDPNCCQILWLGLQLAQTSDTLHSPKQYPASIQSIYKSQKIGWNQLYYGHFLTKRATVLAKENPKVDPIKLLTKILETIWTQTLKLWDA